MVFSPKNLQLRRKIRGCFCRVFWCKKSTSRLARNMHHKDTYLRLKQTAIPHLCPAGREYQSSCVCVPPGGPLEGILDVAEYIVCRVVFFLFVLVFYPSTIFFRRSCKFFGEKTIVAKKKERKKNMQQKPMGGKTNTATTTATSSSFNTNTNDAAVRPRANAHLFKKAR